MKTDSMVMTTINRKDMKELLKETKETLATDVLKTPDGSNFAEVDMWRLRKNVRTSASMKRRLR